MLNLIQAVLIQSHVCLNTICHYPSTNWPCMYSFDAYTDSSKYAPQLPHEHLLGCSEARC